jgi:hypothetical protein
MDKWPAYATETCAKLSERRQRHDKSYIVELEDGSAWRIWPGDLAITLLHWMPSTRLEVAEIDHECCTHALVDRLHGTCVRVIEADAAWAPDRIEASASKLRIQKLVTPASGAI